MITIQSMDDALAWPQNIDGWHVCPLDATVMVKRLDYLYVRGNLCIDGCLDIGGNLYWCRLDPPNLPLRSHVGLIVPPEHQHSYWSKRTGLPLTGCYRQIMSEVSAAQVYARGPVDGGSWSPVEAIIVRSWMWAQASEKGKGGK